MEGKIIDSFRLIFVDIDQSYNIPVADSAIQGYMVCRAPKGSTEAVYFSKGSTNQIHAMLGIPTADWPDIQDALDLNASYGLWISAPPGSSADYPSYFGGVYLTKHGLFPFYKITDRAVPNFQVLVNPESEDFEFVHAGEASSTISPMEGFGNPSGFDEIQINDIPPAILSSMVGLSFNFWGNSGAPSAYSGAASYQLVLEGNSLKVENPDGAGTMMSIGSLSNGTLTLTGTNTSGSSSFMYFDFEQLVSSAPYKSTSGDWLSAPDHATYLTLVHTALLNSLQWIVDVTDTTYMTISQKTQTEKETFITLSDIGYDAYAYDYALDAYKDEPYPATYTPGTGGPYYPTPADVENANGLYVQFFTTQGAPSVKCVNGIYQSTGAGTPPVNVTMNYRNKFVRITNAGIRRTTTGVLRTPPRDTIETSAYIDQIYYVSSSGTLQLVKTAAHPEGIANPRYAPNFNQVTFSVVEDVYPGDATSGGTFTGSLSQTGTDGYGGNIYYPNVLPENALSDVDVAVYRTFDNDLNGSGFFDLLTGYKVIDTRIFDATTQNSTNQQLPASITTGSFGMPTVIGQRHVTGIVNSLIASGSTGGVVDVRFTPLLIDGWTEAAKGQYEVCPVFAEVTGTEDLKGILYNLRLNTHKVSTFVSPRIISVSEANDPSSIVITGRLTGTAQLVNQALRSDTYTGAKYWTNLVGAYAAELLYIMDGKLGGWAPMWTSIAGYGGQLPVSVNKMKYEFTQAQLEAFDTIGLNPITMDPTYGLMVVSQKTTQDPDNLSDWSYLGHSMAFDLFKREVRDNVMVPQIGKPNDSYYQAMRQRQVEALLNRRTGGAEPIWAAGKVEVANVNTSDVKAQRKFAIRVTVKVNVFSEYVELTFVNVAATTQI